MSWVVLTDIDGVDDDTVTGAADNGCPITEVARIALPPGKFELLTTLDRVAIGSLCCGIKVNAGDGFLLFVSNLATIKLNEPTGILVFWLELDEEDVAW